MPERYGEPLAIEGVESPTPDPDGLALGFEPRAPGAFAERVHGCGCVGLSAVHLADAMGASTVAVDVREEPLAMADDLGATDLFRPPIFLREENVVMGEDIHRSRPVDTAGEPLDSADAAAILIHGRGASAGSILSLAEEFDAPGVAYLAPAAANRTWYPNPFTAPIESNQPHLDSALAALADIVEDVTDAGIGADSLLVLGFSQGACLAAEFVARNPRRYGGLAVLSGGLIGPAIEPDDYGGDLEGTPAFVGCSDTDPHIPVERVEATAEILAGMGADVTERIYPGMGHTINTEEVSSVADMIADLARRRDGVA